MSFFLLTADPKLINFFKLYNLNYIISKIQISVSKKRPPQDLGPNCPGLSSFGGVGGGGRGIGSEQHTEASIDSISKKFQYVLLQVFEP